MPKYSKSKLRKRVFDAADQVMQREGVVTPLELLQEMRLLEPCHVKLWLRGHDMVLAEFIQGSEQKRLDTFEFFTQWTSQQKCEPIELSYKTATRHEAGELQITPDGDSEQEAFYRIGYRFSALSDKEKRRVERKQNKAPELVVHVLTSADTECHECKCQIAEGDCLFLERGDALCLTCADLAHLEFLPAGDAAITRRSKKHSPLWAVVVRFNRRRRRYERQGLLVNSSAIDQAEQECQADAHIRERRREAQAQRARHQDAQLVEEMAGQIVAAYPSCNPDEATQIAKHTAVRGSGRVGRSAAGRALQPEALRLAVRAWIRHQHTPYDDLLMQGVDRQSARDQIADQLETVIQKWS